MSVRTVIIMGAGHGTRMRSKTAKMLHPLCGRPLILWPVEAAREAGAERVVAVLGPENGDVRRVLPPAVEVAIQAQATGTAGALISARAQLEGAGDVIVLSGDHPLLDGRFLAALADHHARSGAAATVTTTELEEPGRYGRIVRDSRGEIERIVETKTAGEASDSELAIREVNTGTYVFKGAPLLDALAKVRSDNSQGELYLGDVLPILRASGHKIAAYRTDDEAVGLGVNTRADLAAVQAICRHRIIERHMLAGVTVADPASTVIDAGVRIGEDTVIEPYSFLRGQVEVGRSCRVGPMTTLTDCVLGDDVSVVHSYLDGCEVLDGATVGPFAYLRPGTTLHERAKAGTFVEIKNSEIGAGTKVPHLSYIGDAEIGAGTNIGAGNITANYDGSRKHRTVIGANVHTGVDTSFVAPVSVGDRAYTGAGSVITSDVPEGALGIARAEQANVEDYDERSRKSGADGEPVKAAQTTEKARQKTRGERGA